MLTFVECVPSSSVVGDPALVSPVAFHSFNGLFISPGMYIFFVILIRLLPEKTRTLDTSEID